MKVKYIVTVNSLDDVLIYSKQFRTYDDTFNYIAKINLDIYKVNIYNILEG